ncbi:YSIRK-type signal peptide-containing protein [Weissella uvarum]|nr:YSIRK-type signal peptide-containing protein [Weissella uvarum]
MENQKYAIRKLSVGVGSVLIGLTIGINSNAFADSNVQSNHNPTNETNTDPEASEPADAGLKFQTVSEANSLADESAQTTSVAESQATTVESQAASVAQSETTGAKSQVASEAQSQTTSGVKSQATSEVQSQTTSSVKSQSVSATKSQATSTAKSQAKSTATKVNTKSTNNLKAKVKSATLKATTAAESASKDLQGLTDIQTTDPNGKTSN